MDKQTADSLLVVLQKMEENLQEVRRTVEQAIAQPVKQTAKKVRGLMAESIPASLLGPVPDLHHESWPAAAQNHMILDDNSQPEKHKFRALQITRLLGDYDGKKVLDVGCGLGWVTREIAKRAALAVGYDLLADCRSEGKLTFTNDTKEVEQHRYDRIVMFDTLDHLTTDNHSKYMTWLGSLLSPDGQIFVRTHPWTSRHGGHLYEQGLNKAFAHLACTTDELTRAGYRLPNVFRTARPLAVYESIFRSAGLKVADRKTHSETVDYFFNGEILDRIIKVTWNGQVNETTALKIMANSYIDFTLVAGS